MCDFITSDKSSRLEKLESAVKLDVKFNTSNSRIQRIAKNEEKKFFHTLHPLNLVLAYSVH